jgi:hypothetical protein
VSPANPRLKTTVLAVWLPGSRVRLSSSSNETLYPPGIGATSVTRRPETRNLICGNNRFSELHFLRRPRRS